MDMNEKQYERIARYLDGENVALQPDEQAFVEEIHRAETLVGAALDVAPPADALQRAMHHRHTVVLHRSRRTLRLTLSAAAVVAAAAVVLLALSLLWKPLPQADLPDLAQDTLVPRPSADVPVSDMIDSLKAVSTLDQDLDQLTEEFEREEFGIAATPEIVGETDGKPDEQKVNLRHQDKHPRNAPDKIDPDDSIEAY